MRERHGTLEDAAVVWGHNEKARCLPANVSRGSIVQLDGDHVHKECVDEKGLAIAEREALDR